MPIKLIGKLDLVAFLVRPSPGLYHVQTKTLSAYSRADLYAKKIAQSMHEKQYGVLGRLNGLPLRGVLLNVFQKTVPGEWDRKAKERKINPSWSPFFRTQITITQKQRKEWVEDVKMLTGWIGHCGDVDWWPRNDASCVWFNKVCPYYQPCRGGMAALQTGAFVDRERDYAEESEAWNVSTLHDFYRCPKYYWFKHVKGVEWEHEEEEKSAAHFGSMIHAALEAWYGPGSCTLERRELELKTGEIVSGWRPCLDDDLAIQAFRDCTPEGHDERCKEVERTWYGEEMLKRYFEKYREQDRANMELVVGVEMVLEGEI